LKFANIGYPDVTIEDVLTNYNNLDGNQDSFVIY